MLFFIEVTLGLLLYLEPPGAMDDQGHFKTVSQGFIDHPGVGAALCLCLILETCYILIDTPRTAFFVWLTQVGALGAYQYQSGKHAAHAYFAIIFFASSLCLTTQLWYQRLIVTAQWLVPLATFVFLALSFWYWPEAAGALELTYIYFMLNSWVPNKNSRWVDATTLRL